MVTEVWRYVRMHLAAVLCGAMLTVLGFGVYTLAQTLRADHQRLEALVQWAVQHQREHEQGAKERAK